MATFVDVCPEEEQLLALVQYVSALKQKKEASSGLESEAGQLVQEGKFLDVITRLISEHEAIFSDTNDKEIEACMNVLSTSINKLDEGNATKTVELLKQAIISNTSDRPLLRLRILTNIYHAFDRNAASRFGIFLALTNYAAESGNAELVIPKFKQIDGWLIDWGASVEQTRTLYNLARKILATNNRSLQAHELITKYLQTFNNDIKEGKQVGHEVIDIAAEASKEAISSEEIYQCDHLFSLEAVKLLEKDSRHAVLYKLLQIFAQEKLEAFQTFQAQNPGFLQTIGLAEEQCSHKMRLLSLASLAAENNEIPYDLIASTLRISEDDVESWVIEAVSAKLIEAKMNQIKKTVTISYCVQRIFTIAQWKQLGSKLNKWKNSVHHLLQTVQQTKAVDGVSPQQQIVA